MYTMLYDAETLKPELLVEEYVSNGEVGKFFWVINGEWGGTFNEDSVTINNPHYGNKTPDTVYKCYKFTSSPPKEYSSEKESRAEFGIDYNSWFAHFEDLVVKGEIE